MQMKLKRKIYISFLIFLSLVMFSVASCGVSKVDGVVTHTPTITLTPTCLPVSLSTPEGWAIKSNLFVILYDPRSVGEEELEFEDKEDTRDVTVFIRKFAPKIMKPGDQLAVFQLGYSTYDAAKVTRLTSYTSIPPLYNTPSPKATLTPLPAQTIVSGFGPVQATNQARVSQTQRAIVAGQDASEYNCQKQYWNDNVAATAGLWNVTATAEVIDLTLQLNTDFENFLANPEILEVPFRTNELYYGGLYNGLSFATTVFESTASGCTKYTSCNLILIDDLEVWGHDNPDNLSINLSGVNTYVIMPNCEDIDSSSCQKPIDYWNVEFEKMGVTTSVKYWNGERAEINLLENIRR